MNNAKTVLTRVNWLARMALVIVYVVAIYLPIQWITAPPVAHAGTIELQYVTGTATPDTRGGMVVDDQYVWIAGHQQGLWRANCCDGSGAGDVSSADSGSWDLWWYNATGNYPHNPDAGYILYEGGKSGTVYIFNTSNPATPVGAVTAGGVVYGVYATEPATHKLYVSTTAGVKVYDIANPTSPVLLTTVRPDLQFVAGRSELNHGYLYAASYSDNKIYVIRIADDMVMSSIGFGMTGMIRRPWTGTDDVGNRYVYVVNDYGDLWIVNANNPAAPTLVSYWNSPYGGATNMPGGNVWVSKGYAYVMTGTGNHQGYLYMLDVRDPAHPALVDYLYDAEFGFNEIRVEDCVIQMAAHNGWKLYRASGWQPDMWISNTDTSNYVGQNVYEATPSVQVKSQTLARGQTATYQLRVENDANRRDKFLVHGTGGAANWTVQYLQGTTDVTAPVVGGTFLAGYLEPAEYITLTLKVTPGPGANCGDTYDVDVTPNSWMCPDGGCTSAVDVVRAHTSLGCAQMTLAKTDGQTTVYPGDPLPYVISYTSNGTTAAVNVVVTDTLPAGTTYVSASPTPVSVTPGGGGTTIVVWNVGAVAVGGGGSISLNARVDGATLPGSTLTNQVQLTFSDASGNSYAPLTAQDVDTVGGAVPPSQATLTKTVDKDFAYAGEQLSYSLTPSYAGSSLLSSVTITDAVPAGTSYVAGSANAGGSESGGVVTWNLGSNAAGVPGYQASGGNQAGSITTRLTASADNWLRQDAATTNYGTDAQLRTRPNPGPSQDNHAIVLFDLSGIPAGATVVSATFGIYEETTRDSTQTITLYRLTESWTESGSTWNSRNGTNNWSTAGGTYNATSLGSFAPTAVGFKTFSVGSVVQNWLNGTYANDGFILVATTTNQTGDVRFTSRDNASASDQWPYLDVTYQLPDAGTITLTPIKDTYLDAGNSGRNYGSCAYVQTDDESSKRERALLQFDLSNFASACTINSASLTLTQIGEAGTSNASTVNAHRVTADWTEGTQCGANGVANWNDRMTGTSWGTAGGDYDATVVGSTTVHHPGVYTWTITSLAQGWVSSTYANYGLLLESAAAGSNNFKQYASREGTTPADRPRLRVSYTCPAAANTGNSLSVTPLLAAAGQGVTVTMSLTATRDVANVSPSALTIIGTNGASATCGSPSPASQTVTAGLVAQFTWVCTAASSGNVGQLTFGASASGSGITWAAATSNSVIVAPALTFQARVAGPPATVSVVHNLGYIRDGSGAIPTTPSNIVATAIADPPSPISKAVNTAAALAGQTLYYTVTSSYTGGELLTNAVITDAIPAGATYVPGSANAGASYGNGVITWTLGSNAAGLPGVATGTGGSGSPTPTTGMAVWYSSSGSATKYDPWNGSAFTGAANTASLGTITQGLQGAASPTRNEKVIIGIDASGALKGEVWNGASWTLIPSAALGSPGFSHQWAYDAVYEQASGDALIAFADGASALKYAVWNGSAWSTAATVSDYSTLTSNTPKRVSLAARPGADEIALVVTDNLGATFGFIWNGASWGAGALLGSGAWSNTIAAVAYEQQSGRPMAAYGKGWGDAKVYYRFWNGSSWTAEAALDPSVSPVVSTCTPNWLALAADPTSNRIGVGVQTVDCSSSNRLWAGVWDGSTWTSRVALAIQPTGYTYPNIAIAWESASGQLLTAFGDSATANTVMYRSWSSTGLWSGVASGPNVAAAPNVLSLEPDPNADQIMLAAQNASGGLYYARWGGAPPFDAPIRLETNTGGATNYQPFLFLWDNVPWTASQVNASSDDAEEEGPDGVNLGPGGMYLISTDLEMTQDLEAPSSGTQKVGMRFNNVGVPQGATISNAYITFRAIAPDSPNTNSGATSLTIRGQAADNPTTFTSTAYNISNRATTTASVAWSPAAWTTGTDYSTPDLKTVVQEIVNRSGWASGNSMVFIITGTGSRSAESWNNTGETGTDGTNQPRLVIEYQVGGGSALSLGNTMSAAPTLVAADGTITVTQVLTASQSIANVTPSALTITGTNGVGATLVSGPTPTSATVGPSGATFTWVYQATSGGNIGQLTFGAQATGGGNTWPRAQSNSVIVHPALTFRATVNNPATAGVITNTAYIRDTSAAIPFQPSNSVTTAVVGSIGDRVWSDPNGNGLQDVGETGLISVTVKLYADSNGNGVLDTGEPLLGSTETGANGIYTFSSLVAGSYIVYADERDGHLPINFSPTTRDPLTVTLGIGQVYTEADFGFTAYGRITGLVWEDRNGDTLADLLEPGWDNVRLILNTPSGQVTTTTTGGGYYIFRSLPSGAYTVTVDGSTIPPGYNLTTGVITITADLGVGQSDDGNNFGYRGVGVIGDFVWRDLDGDGVQDGGAETGIPDITVWLYTDANGNGRIDPSDTLLSTTATDASGNYSFTELAPGAYLVDVDQHDPQMPLYTNSTPDPLAVTLAAGQTYNDADFGFGPYAQLGDFAWFDKDGDGVQDAGEPGLPGVVITLTGGSSVRTTVSDANGYYLFDLIEPGAYTVTVAGPTGYALTTGNVPFPITLGVGDYYMDADFGFRGAGAVGDLVWRDNNANGLYEPGLGETGIAGVSVYLFVDANGDGRYNDAELLYAIGQTDANGNYLITNVRPARYTALVWVTDPALPSGYGPSTLQPIPINLTGGGTFLDADFGFAGKGSIGDTVFFDANANGERDMGTGDEYGIANITVWLWWDANGNGVIDGGDTKLYTATTNLNGNYFFGGLSAGGGQDYLAQMDMADPDLPTGLHLTTLNPHPVTDLATGQYYDQADFGLNGNSSIGDFVWRDRNGNGLQDGGAETGLANITVELWRDMNANGTLDAGDTRVGTMTTDPNGLYLFSNLPQGTYFARVDETDPDMPSTYNPTTPNPLRVDIIAASTDYRDADFGFGPFGVIGDLVWNDVDGDRSQDAGELGLSGVTLRLYSGACPPGGAPISTASTDGNGSYRFMRLAAGPYCVDVDEATLPAGFALTTGNEPLSVILAAGQEYTGADFGYRAVGSVSGLVWNDLSGNGAWDLSEPGLSGVAIELYSAGPDGILGTVDDVLWETTVTLGDGSYAFTGVPIGAYRVIETDPPGYASTTLNAVDVIVPAGGSATADFGDILPTAVQVAAFTATREPDGVRLRWTVMGFTAGDFGVYRATHPQGPYGLINQTPVTSATGNFEYLDRNANVGATYWYKLHWLANGGWFGPIVSEPALPIRTFVPFIAR
jgi:uncharacterized repeat protein (TIGR01451 family)